MYRRYGFIKPRYSSVPAELTGPNGFNFSRSVGDPSSRLERVRVYLRDNGPSTKRAILRDVFGKTVRTGPWQAAWPDTVTIGWGGMFWSLGVRHGFFTKTRKGRTVLWSVK